MATKAGTEIETIVSVKPSAKVWKKMKKKWRLYA